MNDNDIIKVGECIRGEKVLCLSCPYRARFPDCRKYAIRDIFDLVSRQKAELQRLEKQKYEDDETIIKLNHELLTVVVAAVKEFAERFENELTKIEDIYIDEEHENFISANKVIALLVNLVKEMGG